MLELFKGQLSITDLNSMSLRELFALRDIRLKRYEKERKAIEDEQRARDAQAQKERAAMERANTRNSILRK